jgi:hypothetical protein
MTRGRAEKYIQQFVANIFFLYNHCKIESSVTTSQQPLTLIEAMNRFLLLAMTRLRWVKAEPRRPPRIPDPNMPIKLQAFKDPRKLYLHPSLQRKSHLCIPRKGIARPQSQFPHSCVCERFISSQDRSTYFPGAEQADQSWEYINRSETHECGNWD